MTPSIVNADQYDDRNLIESIINSYFIIDYGFISEVNVDNTVNVIHAKKLKARTGENLPETITKNIEVLTLCSKGFSFSIPYEKGDKVLLLGFKDFVKSTDSVTQATENLFFIHYDRETMKALPLCVFNSKAKIKIEAKDGNLTIGCSKFSITDSNGTTALEVTP